jgi:hypothetical protein
MAEFAAIRDEGLAAFIAVAPPGCAGYFRHEDRYYRGLLRSLVGSGLELAPHLEGLFRAAPITELEVTDGADALLRRRELQRVRKLRLGYRNWLERPAELVQALVACSNLGGLTKLWVESVWFYDWKWTSQDSVFVDQLSTADWDQLFKRFGPEVLVDNRINGLGEPKLPLRTAD